MARPSLTRLVGRALALAGLSVVTLVVAPGCESKLEQKDCDKLRGEAFDLLNKAQPCANDTECHQSVWPGCEKPSNQKTLDAIAPLQKSFTEGKCEEKKVECRKAPQSYCKQGLCVHKEVGITPTDEIQIQ